MELYFGDDSCDMMLEEKLHFFTQIMPEEDNILKPYFWANICFMLEEKLCFFRHFFYLKKQEFTGNWDNEVPHIHLLEEPITAKFIRILPETASSVYNAMRVGLFGCLSDKTQTKGLFPLLI